MVFKLRLRPHLLNGVKNYSRATDGFVLISPRHPLKNRKDTMSLNEALFVKLEAKPGKEAEVENFLRDGLAVVEREAQTIVWFALRMGPATFGIFDAFPDEAGREAHLQGQVAAALKEKAGDLLAKPPAIMKASVLAAKVPR